MTPPGEVTVTVKTHRTLCNTIRSLTSAQVRMSSPVVLVSAILVIASTFFLFPLAVRSLGRVVGWHLRRTSQSRREAIYERVRQEQRVFLGQQPQGTAKEESEPTEDDGWERIEKSTAGFARNGDVADVEWGGVIGFFHPFCNAGGGGERVLWAAIKAVQQRWPNAVCIVYTGDQGVDKTSMLSRVETRFDIRLYPPTLVFVYLTARHYVLSSTYTRFTLLGQSLGSLILAYEAFGLLCPDVFIDTMGYAFAIALSKHVLPDVPTAAYVHYPTISTDMLDSLEAGGHGLNAGAGKGVRGFLKKTYWQLFARMYGWVGGHANVVMVNSSWTQAHIRSLWGASRAKRGIHGDVDVVFPPVAVEQVEEQIEVSAESEKERERILLYIAQFRSEKNHNMILEAFASLVHGRSKPAASSDETPPRLVLVGSIRHRDDATRVYELRLLAHELKIKELVEFVCDASWPEILDWLRRSWVGVNGMWNEHFGIGIVEYQAAGLISVVHDSGGPKSDIVVDHEGGPTGFHATSSAAFAQAFEKALSMSPDETLAMRRRARASAQRFTEQEFTRRWLAHVEGLVDLC